MIEVLGQRNQLGLDMGFKVIAIDQKRETETPFKDYSEVIDHAVNMDTEIGLNKGQLEDFIVTCFEGGSNYWMDITEESFSHAIRSRKPFSGGVSTAEIISDYLWSGGTIELQDSEDDEERWELSQEMIHKAFNNTDIAECCESFILGTYDVWTTDTILQYAVLGEVVYG